MPFFYATFHCGRYGVFKKNLKYFFDPEKVEKWASKVAHNRPRPSYFTVQPRPTAHSPELIFHIGNCWDQTSVLLFVQLHCLFDEIGIIFEPLMIAIFQLCLLPKMRLSVDLEGRFTGYKFLIFEIWK